MPIYSVQGPDGRIYDVEGPAGASEAQIISVVQDNLKKQQNTGSFGDAITAAKQAALGSAKALTDIAGANNFASNYLEEKAKSQQAQYSPAAQQEMKAQAERMKAAEASGSTLEEIKAGALNVAEAPLRSLAQGVGSLAPYVPAMLLGPIGGALRLAPTTMRALTGVAEAAPKVLGTAQGVGAVKGSIYDAVYENELKATGSEQIARNKADTAQSYAGNNLDNLIAAGVLGFVAGSTGAEKLLTKSGAQGAAQGLKRRLGQAAGEEFITEGAQGGQERFAQNIALQREGVDIPAMQGVAGQAVQEGLVGALTAGPVAALRSPTPTLSPEQLQLQAQAQEQSRFQAEAQAQAQAQAIQDAETLALQESQAKATEEAYKQSDQYPIDLGNKFDEVNAQRLKLQERADALKRGDVVDKENYKYAKQELDEFNKTVFGPLLKEYAPLRARANALRGAAVPPVAPIVEAPVAPPESVTPPAEVPVVPAVTPAPPAEVPITEATAPPEVPVVETPPAETPPTETPVDEIPPPGAPKLKPTLGDYFTGLPEGNEDIYGRIQNRDRTSGNSIAQMQSILKDPDYDRLSNDPNFGSGAPVVSADAPLPEEFMGNIAIATAVDGRKIPFQYAVVDAKSLLASHTASGQPVPEYGNLANKGIRAVAGNGRVAGLQAAYINGNAENYKSKLLGDTVHGISPESIAQVQNPVLVRVMRQSDITPDIGDISNVGTGLAMTPTEMAKNDANRVKDLGSFNFLENDEGNLRIDDKALLAFISMVPKNEQGGLVEKNGRPNQVAADRLQNAIFYKAYGSDSLITLYAEARDPEAKLILQAMGKAAPAMARLEGAGQYDVRKYVVDAAEMAVNARRTGQSIQKFLDRGVLDLDPNTGKILQMFADNSRSGAKIGDRLTDFANEAYKAANQEEDMFGAKPEIPLTSIFDMLSGTQGGATAAAESKEFQISDKSFSQIEKEVTEMKPLEVTQWLIDNAPNSAAKYIAQKVHARIKDFIDNGINISFIVSPQNKIMQGARGTNFTRPRSSGLILEVTVNPVSKNKKGYDVTGTSYRTIMHEFLHAATSPQVYLLGRALDTDFGKISNLSKSQLQKDLTPLLNTIRKQIKTDLASGKQHPFLLDYAKRKKPTETFAAFVKNTAELISYGLTESHFQDYLKGVKVADKNAFTALVEIFRKLLGIDANYQSALEELARAVDVGLDVSAYSIKKMANAGTQGRLMENVNLDNADSESIATPTSTGQQVLDNLQKMGREVKPPEPGYGAKVSQSWDNVRDNPKATVEEAKVSFQRFADLIQTMSFSSDAALNNQIRREIMASSAGQEEKIGLLLNTSLSQTFHSDAVANLFLRMGDIKYNAEIHKWEGVESKNNFVSLSQSIDKIATQYGLTKEQAELAAHTAFEAKRTKSLVKFNEELKAKVAELRAAAADERKKGNAVKASALSDQASTMAQRDKFIHMSDEDIETGLNQIKLMPELNESIEIWNGIRENTVQKLIETGLWSEADADFLLSNADYVPFYREEQLENGKGPKEYIGGLQVQAKERRLKGSSKPVNDIFDNMVRWTQYSVNRAVRNRSALSLAETANSLGLATEAKNMKDGANVVRVWKDGKETYFDMKDPLYMHAFQGLEAVSIPTIKVLSKFADILRNSVVLNPLFSITQIPQDAFAAMFSSGLKPQFALTIPFRAVKEFLLTLTNKSKSHEALKRVGIAGVRDFSTSMVRLDAEIAAGLKPSKGLWGKVKDSLGHFAMASDNAVRQATYEAAMAQGLSRAEAIEKSFEIFNVRRRGSSKMLNIAGQVIPFFNAYLTAQNVAYRTLTGVGSSPTEKAAAYQTLLATSASTFALATLYAMMNGDDEDYINKPTPTRDRLLMIPGTGMAIPLRSDLFTLPKVVAEHTYLLLTNNGYEDGAKFRASISSVISSALLSPTPVPQAIKPLVEVAINYNFFQQKPLIGTFQQKKDVERQFEDSTSELGKLFGKTGLISPIGADHIIRGMFGSAGGMLLYATNPFLWNASAPNTPRPSLSIQDALATIPNASGVITREYESGLKKDFYALKEVVDKASSTLTDMKQRSPLEAGEYVKDEKIQARLGLKATVANINTQLSNIRKSIGAVTNSDLSADAKEERIRELKKAENNMMMNLNLKALREKAMM